MANETRRKNAKHRWEPFAAIILLGLEFLAAITLTPEAWRFACVFGVLAVVAGVRVAWNGSPIRRTTGVLCAGLAFLLLVVVLADVIT